MSLGNMREHGVRSVLAICQEVSCGHSGLIDVDALPDDFAVPAVSVRLRCFEVRIAHRVLAPAAPGTVPAPRQSLGNQCVAD